MTSVLKLLSAPLMRPHPLHKPLQPQHVLPLRRTFFRCYSASHFTQAAYDVEVPCRSSGSITLNVFPPRHQQTQHLPVSPSHVSRSLFPLLLFLPTNPLHPAANAFDNHILQTFVNKTSSALVRINYRLGQQFQYPTPVHDVLAGYEHVVSEILPTIAQLSNQQDALGHSPDSQVSVSRSRIGVYGQLIGGSLAATLALTECRLGVHRIRAAALRDPIVDWPSILDGSEFYTTPHSSRRNREQHNTDEDAVLADMASAIRVAETDGPDNIAHDPYGVIEPFPEDFKEALEQELPITTIDEPLDSLPDPRLLFRKPEQTTDRFSSPLLFFRSPHLEFGNRTKTVSFAALATDVEPEIDSDGLEVGFDHNEIADTDDLSEMQTPVDQDVSDPPPPESEASLDEATKVVPMGPGPHPRRRSHRVHPPLDSVLPSFHVTLTSSNPTLHKQGEEFARLVRRSASRTWMKDHTGRGWAEDDSLDEISGDIDPNEKRKEHLKTLSYAADKFARNKVRTSLVDGDQEQGIEDSIQWLRRAMEENKK